MHARAAAESAACTGPFCARPRHRIPEMQNPPRRRVCISGEECTSARLLSRLSPPRLLTILDQKADLAVDAKHRDLIVLDDDFGILDPKRTDAAQGLRCFANGLAASVVEPVRRLSDNLDVPYDRHRPLLPLYLLASNTSVRKHALHRLVARRINPAFGRKWDHVISN